MSASQTGISVTCKYPFLAFLMFMFKPVIEVDGTATAGAWSGSTFIPASAGSHQISICWKYFFVLPVNKASATVNVTDGAATAVNYKAAWMVFLPGKIVVGQPGAVPAGA